MHSFGDRILVVSVGCSVKIITIWIVTYVCKYLSTEKNYLPLHSTVPSVWGGLVIAGSCVSSQMDHFSMPGSCSVLRQSPVLEQPRIDGANQI
jgi:hypothetical protein